MNIALIQNIIMYQVAWLLCVIGAAKHFPWLASGMVIAMVIAHLLQQPNPKKEALFVVLAALIGGTLDQVLNNHDFVLYQSHGWSNNLVPVWILALWLAFACTFSISLRWLNNRHFLCTLLGAIAGPLAYIAAQKLGAVGIATIPNSYYAIALGWAIVFPTLMSLSSKINHLH